MKKSLFFLTIASLGIFSVLSCQKEIAGEDLKLNDGKQITVVVNPSVETKAALEDAESIYWEAGESLQAVSAGGAATANATLGADKYHASFSFNLTQGNSYVFRSNPHGNDEFEYSNNMTQAEAGVMNKSYLFLQSGKTYAYTATEANPTLTPAMQIVGTILRFIPYTTQSSYEAESVQSVQVVAPNKFIGTIGFNYSTGAAKEFGGQDPIYFWAGQNTATVTLTESFSLSGIDAKEKSSGIYMPIPAAAGQLNSGYTVVVTTNLATYTFNSTKAMTLTDNSIVNIGLDLKKGSRVPLNAYKCKWQGIAQNTEYAPAAIDYHAYTAGGNVLGFHEAWLKSPEEENFTTKPAPPTIWSLFYEPATFTVTDATTGLAVTWCSFAFRANDSWIIPTVDENTSSISRKAKVVVTFPSVVTYDTHDYYVTEDSKTLTFYLTQPGKPDVEFSVATTSYAVAPEATSVVIPVHAENASWTATCTDGGVSLSGNSGSSDGNVTVSFAANTGAKKTYTVHISTTASVDPDEYDVVITHQAAPDPNAEWLGEYSFDYNGIISDGLGTYLTYVGNTITINVPLANTPNPFYMHLSHNNKVYLQNLGSEIPDEEGHPGHRAAPYVDGADWTTPVWCAAVGTHTFKFTAVGENGATKTITLVVNVSEK